MKVQLLTELEYKIFNQLKSERPKYIRNHITPKGTRVYRFLDDRWNPLFNLPTNIVDRLVGKRYLKIDSEGGDKVVIINQF